MDSKILTITGGVFTTVDNIASTSWRDLADANMENMRLWGCWMITQEEYNGLDELINANDLQSIVVAQEALKELRKTRLRGQYKPT